MAGRSRPGKGTSLIKRRDIEDRERLTLAPYAALSGESRGRRYPQQEHPLRTAFQRDRDRIVHSAAFRRMEYKTQVFLPHEGDHLRTRLTHTIEVAQISRTLARALRLNEDLSEAIALAHDLGHTPFGHSGEDVLSELLGESGGFNHNMQSLRVVDLLEEKYASYPGLNLTYEVREGIAKHETNAPTNHPDFDNSERPTLEASLVDTADEIAYNAHDIDDGLRSGLIDLEEVGELTIWDDESTLFGADLGRLTDDGSAAIRYRIVRWLVNRTATDVIMETTKRLEKFEITSLEALRAGSDRVCQYSPEVAAAVLELKEFLQRRLYHSPQLVARAVHAREVIETLYRRFYDDPARMPSRYRDRLETEARELVIADYIAGMTDRYAEQVLSGV
ncbi:MAG: deoxyguanosinetriphosphate triphosphohydrolase [Candidatus Zixiibacteriota bacterium]|nr:MAG: deoxyguanosinetriphosphate triphosphohydrolase [candidate division Zixibacteria bacterium]